MPSLMESIVTLDVGAQEPWPSDVKLYQPYAMEQILLPDNANCLAVQAFLHMCGLPFQIEHRANAEFMSPSGKVPFIKCGAFVVSELEPIVQFVANKGITLTEDLSADQKSDLRAYMSIIYTVLMNAELYICWCDKRTYNEVTKVRNGSVYPWPLNHFQTWSKRSAVNRKLKVLGWYQKTLDSVYQEVENCCQALSERLDGKEYFFGSKPSELDAYLYGNIFAILSSPEYSNELITIVMKYSNLVSHCKRICTNYVNNTSLNFSELLEPTKSASKLIMNNNTCTYELKPTNEVTAITRYLKFVNSDSDLSELSNAGSSRESCKSSSEYIKRTSSMTDCSVFETNKYKKEQISAKPTEKYQSLSQSDHDYLTNLFCSDKPSQTEVKYMKLKNEFSDSSLSSEESVNLEKTDSKISLNNRNNNKKMSNASISNKESGIQEKMLLKNDSKILLTTINEEKKKSDTLLNVECENTGKIVSKKFLTIVNEDKKVSDTFFFSGDSVDQGINVSKKRSMTNVLESSTNSYTSLSNEESGLQRKKVSKKSLISVSEDDKYLDFSISSAESGMKNSKKSLFSANEDKRASSTSFSSLEAGKQDKKVSKKSLLSINENDTYLDFSITSEESGFKLSKKSTTSINEGKYLDISISSEESGIKLSKKSTSINDGKYMNISMSSEESGIKLSKKSSNMNDGKYMNISMSSKESGIKLSQKSSTCTSNSKYVDISITSEESEKQEKFVTPKSLTIANENTSVSSKETGRQGITDSLKSLSSIDEDDKYLDISTSSDDFEKGVSQTITNNEDKQITNISVTNEERKVSKKSLTETDDISSYNHLYSDLSISSLSCDYKSN